ncbi:MAG: A24 family peptidase [Vicinamibacterales bacterium]
MAPILVLILGLAIAVVIDVRSRRIPNWLTGAIAGAGFGLAAGGAAVTPGQAALGLFAGLGLMMPGHLIGATGAGDVKLMAAIGTVVGPSFVFRVFLYSAVAGGVLALVVAARRGIVAATVRSAGHLIVAPREARARVESPARVNRFAYGPAIAAGTFAALFLR